jgi:hypothetical protein
VAAHRHNATGLKDLALEFILDHLNDPVVMEGLSDLRAEPDLLLEIIRRKAALPIPINVSNGAQQNELALAAAAEWDVRR